METNRIKNRLIEMQQFSPALTFDNDGYQYLPKEIRDNYKKQIDEISLIIKKIDPSFVKFFNFKPRKNGSFAIRYDCYYGKSFIGVNYLEIDKL